MTSNTPKKLFQQFQAQTAKGEELELILYKSDTCFYCHRVLEAVNSLSIPLVLQDTRRDPGARKRLIKLGGKPQVPCLIINGKPLYESSDIVRFFKKVVVTKAGS
ncbi:MAG: glutaredoxin family protein [Deltaproteobacteria bacterium]|jgi:glutaredoxin 3|nr:glutaredoxin family protein [Deltaproteobacteria bacterium]MBT6435871.1 glutaredoxin family protein [Deltaproteobacteria bacterium]MBT6490916.1 glutaredoxin family protein [Deltaproteobacteria bacterium]